MARPKLDRPNFRLKLRGRVWTIEWWQGGRAHRLSCRTEDRGEAARFLAQFEAGYGSPPPPPSPTIGAILDGYLADRRGEVAAYATLEAATKALRRHLGDLEPAHLTRERCLFYRRRRAAEGYLVGPPGNQRKKPVSDGTVLRELVTLRAALAWAKNERWISEVPKVVVPKAPPPCDRWLTREEADRLLAACIEHHVRLFVLIALCTAQRSGAILGLTWERVNLEARRIDFGEGTGNKCRARAVPINDDLFATLTAARELATCDHVVEFASRRVGSVKTGFRAACRRAGLADVTPHVLRHTAATWMAMARVPMQDIALFLGSSEAMVERVYAKYHPDYLRDAAAAVGGFSRQLARKSRSAGGMEAC